MPKPKQLELIVQTRKGKEKPNKRIPAIRENIRRDKLRAAYERHQQKVAELKTKIRAYGLAWQLIDCGRLRHGSELLEEAWWIAKKLSPAKGASKVGRGAGFKRIFRATTDHLLGLEVHKLRTDLAKRFVEDAEAFLERERITPVRNGLH